MEKANFIPFKENAETAKNAENANPATFKVVANNLPAKPTFFTRLKNILFYEIKVELTPQEQKVEDEINEFLHQEITWAKFKEFLFKEVEVTHKGKKIF